MHRGESRGRHDRDPNRSRIPVEGGEVGVGDQVLRGGIVFDVEKIEHGRIGIRRPGSKTTFMVDPLGLVKKILGLGE